MGPASFAQSRLFGFTPPPTVPFAKAGSRCNRGKGVNAQQIAKSKHRHVVQHIVRRVQT